MTGGENEGPQPKRKTAGRLRKVVESSSESELERPTKIARSSDSDQSIYPRHPCIDDEAEESGDSESEEAERLTAAFGSQKLAKRWLELCQKKERLPRGFQGLTAAERKELVTFRDEKIRRTRETKSLGPSSALFVRQLQERGDKGKEPVRPLVGPSNPQVTSASGEAPRRLQPAGSDSITATQAERDLAVRCRTAFRVAEDRERRAQRKKYRKRLYTCDLCHKAFHSANDKRLHESAGPHQRALQNEKEQKDTPYCRACRRPFPSVHDLKRHIRTAAHVAEARKKWKSVQ